MAKKKGKKNQGAKNNNAEDQAETINTEETSTRIETKEDEAKIVEVTTNSSETTVKDLTGLSSFVNVTKYLQISKTSESGEPLELSVLLVSSFQKIIKQADISLDDAVSGLVNFVIIQEVTIEKKVESIQKEKNKKFHRQTALKTKEVVEVDPVYKNIIETVKKYYINFNSENLSEKEMLQRMVRLDSSSLREVISKAGKSWEEVLNYLQIKIVSFSYEQIVEQRNKKKKKEKKAVEEVIEQIVKDPVYERLLAFMKIYNINFIDQNGEIRSDAPSTFFSLKKIMKLMGTDFYEIIQFLQINIVEFTYEQINQRKKTFATLLTKVLSYEQDSAKQKGIYLFSSDIESSFTWGKQSILGLFEQMNAIEVQIQLRKDMEERAKKEAEEKKLKAKTSKKVIKPTMTVSKKQQEHSEENDEDDQEESIKNTSKTVSSKVLKASTHKKTVIENLNEDDDNENKNKASSKKILHVKKVEKKQEEEIVDTDEVDVEDTTNKKSEVLKENVTVRDKEQKEEIPDNKTVITVTDTVDPIAEEHKAGKKIKLKSKPRTTGEVNENEDKNENVVLENQKNIKTETNITRTQNEQPQNEKTLDEEDSSQQVKKVKLKSKAKKTFEVDEKPNEIVVEPEEVEETHEEEASKKLRGGKIVKIKSMKSQEGFTSKESGVIDENEDQNNNTNIVKLRNKVNTSNPGENAEENKNKVDESQKSKKIVKKVKKTVKKIEIGENLIYVAVEDVIKKQRFIKLLTLKKWEYHVTSESVEVEDYNGFVHYIINIHRPEIDDEANQWVEVEDELNNKVIVRRTKISEIVGNDEVSDDAEIEVEDEKRRVVKLTKKKIISYITEHSQEDVVEEDEKVKYVFSHNIQLNFGEALYVIGSNKELYEWDIGRAFELDSYGESRWVRIKKVKKSSFPFEYKYFISSFDRVNEPVKWLGSDNITVSEANYSMLQRMNPDNLNAMSFNLRYENTVDEVNVWSNRRELVMDTLMSRNFDLFGIQEGRLSQIGFLNKNLNGMYNYFGKSRSWDSNDEQCGIIINHQKLFIQNAGQFWLSDTPYTIGSITYGNVFPRVVTWAQLVHISDIVTGNVSRVCYFFNTHFDHVSAESREPCARVLIREIEKIVSADPPRDKAIIITGSFYSEDEDTPIILIKQNGFKSASEEMDDSDPTFHNFTGEGKLKIDHIFYKVIKSNLSSTSTKMSINYNVIDERLTHPSGQTIYLSDHFPIHAEFSG